jgi:hypothetical protein
VVDYLLTHVPEPSGIVGLAAGSVALVLLPRRARS